MAAYDIDRSATAIEFLNKLSSRGTQFARSGRFEWVFRGQGDSEWDLRPAAFRKPDKLLRHIDTPFSDWDNETQMQVEADTLMAFIEEADHAGLMLPGDLDELRQLVWEAHWPDGVRRRDYVFEWPKPSIWPLLALAQHHGVATRFLDWTWSSAVACYFAATDVLTHQRGGDLAVWAFSTAVVDALRDRDVSNKHVVVATAPYASNPNLRAQNGVHIALRIEEPDLAEPADRDDIGEFLAEIHEGMKARGHRALIKFVLPASEAPSLLWYLAKDGVTAARLFPGYDGAARAVLERQWHRPEPR